MLWRRSRILGVNRSQRRSVSDRQEADNRDEIPVPATFAADSTRVVKWRFPRHKLCKLPREPAASA